MSSLGNRFGGQCLTLYMVHKIRHPRVPRWQRDLVRSVPGEQASSLLARRRSRKLYGGGAPLRHRPPPFPPPPHDLYLVFLLLRPLAPFCARSETRTPELPS